MTVANSVDVSISLERLVPPDTAGCERRLTRLRERLLVLPGVRDGRRRHPDGTRNGRYRLDE